MKKIALIVDTSPDDVSSAGALRSLLEGFSHLGGELNFYGADSGGLIKPLNELGDFQGTVIDLRGTVKEPASENQQSSEKPLCSVIIPVRKGMESAKISVKAVLKATQAPAFELIVVIDGGGGEAAELKSLDRRIRVLLNFKPLGYFSCCSVGAHYARGDYLVFIDESIEPAPGWLESIVHPLQANDEIGIAGAKLLDRYGIVKHAGIIVNRDNLIEFAGYGKPGGSPDVNHFADGIAVSGACLAIGKALFDQIGGFDEDYGDDFAEIDLCWNARNAGKRVVYEPKCEAVVSGGGYFRDDLTSPERQRKFFSRFEKKWLCTAVKRPVKVAVDVRGFNKADTSFRGIGQNLRYQLAALKKYSDRVKLTLLYDREIGIGTALEELGFPLKPYDEFNPGDFDVLHLTDPMNFIDELPLLPPNADGIKVISNFYDLIPLIFPRGYFDGDENSQPLYEERLLELSRRADMFLTISDNTAKDLKKHLSIPDSRVINMRCGVDEKYFRAEDNNTTISLAAEFKIDKPFILYSGSHDYRKRVDLLFKAFSEIHRQMQGNIQLVMTGIYLESFQEAISRLCPDPKVRGDIRFLGHVPEDTLIRLYHSAELFLFPSIYEGFGLPIAEAMASGCPVVACDTSSIPEVTADAALLVQPGDYRALAEAALKILRDSELREVLAEKGRFWARRMTWDKAARKTVEGYLTLTSGVNFLKPETVDSAVQPAEQPVEKPAEPASASAITDRRKSIKDMKVTVEGVFLDKSGYALHTRNMALGLDKLGADVELNHCWFAGAPDIEKVEASAPREEGCIYLDGGDGNSYRYRPYTEPEQTNRILELCRKRSDSGGRTLIVNLPAASPADNTYRRIRERNDGFKRYIGYTMMETGNLPAGWAEACRYMDEIWVPTAFNKETFSRNGVPENKIKVVPLGVDTTLFDPDKTPPVQIPGVKGFNFLSIFQWTKRKGWDILIKAYLQAFSQADDAALVIRSYYKNGMEVESRIRDYITGLGYEIDRIPRISVISPPISAKHMPSLYKACNAFVLPTRGEGWGLPYLEAMAMGMPVIGTRFSAHLDFMNDENSYLIDNLGLEPVDEEQIKDSPLYRGATWGIPSLEHTAELMRRVFENREEAAEKGKTARRDVLSRWTVEHQVERTAQTLLEGENYSLPVEIARGESSKPVPAVAPQRTSKQLKVVMQNRPNSLDAPGGDTEVMRHLKRELEKKGVKVDFNFTLEGVEDYDIVHIFNFVLPEMVKLYSENAARLGRPVVITPMYEDWPLFLNKSFKSFYLFKRYIELNQPKNEFDEIFAPLRRIKPHPRADNSYNLRLAGAVTPSGHSEAERILKDYPQARNVVPMYLGCDLPAADVGPEPFIRETGLRDFVFCVGRVETRKNQLMLLKALEDEEVPLVFATGGFTYQPDYLELCRRFKRKGQTVFLGRLSDDMLVSAYKAAKVHALPSWYELPGMVSVEAAHYDCNVVASPWGTIRDYLGDYAYYAEPDDPEEICRMVMKALSQPVKRGLAEHVRQFTWENAAETLMEIYDSVLAENEELRRFMDDASNRRKEGKIQEACEFYEGALNLHPDNDKALKALNEIMVLKNDPQAAQYRKRLEIIEAERQKQRELNIPSKFDEDFVFEEVDELDRAFELMENGSYAEAETLFKAALEADEDNHRALFGLGKIYFIRERFTQAKDYLEKSTGIHPTGESLITLAGALEKLNLHEQALKALDLISGIPGVNGSFDFDINRLRGHCMLRKGLYSEAEACYQKALSIDDSSDKPHLGLGSLELMKGNYNKAERHFASALQKNARSDKARLGLALVRMEQGREREAFDEARRALDINIENQQAMLVAVKAGFKANRLDAVERFLSKYVELHPANTEILYTLAGVRRKLGDTDGAREAAECILIFKPDHQPAKELLAQLK